VHVILYDSLTDDIIYDNQKDDYLPNLTLNVDQTQRLKIFLEILAEEMTEEEKFNYFGCLGMMIMFKRTE
jgi:hypothetical protein